ncbi:MAG TPA: hypothetical protein VFF27_15905 [Bacteroidia bacterium]|jgi:hypothetical protein|nr:hypothetical protein [Bacteroidia bacterium]
MYKVDVKGSCQENDFCRIWISNGVMFVEYKPGLIMTLETAKFMVNERLRLSDGTSYPVLLDVRNLVSTERAAMKYYKTKEVTRYITSAALLTGNALTSLAGNIFLTLEKPLIPTKLFTDEKKALEWLEKYKFLN